MGQRRNFDGVTLARLAMDYSTGRWRRGEIGLPARDATRYTLSTLTETFGDRPVNRLAARGPLEKRRDAARARIATTSTSATIVAHAGHLGTAWPSLTLDQRRAIVAAVVGAVLISKASKRGPGFDDARVSVDWLA